MILASQAKQNVIAFHLKDLLVTIQNASLNGKNKVTALDLTETQKNLLKEMGYSVDEFSRNFDPIRCSCNISW